jgi:hypothetical protein
LSQVFGKGSLEVPLTDSEVRQICTDALASLPLRQKRVLVIIPDHTRHARISLFFM